MAKRVTAMVKLQIPAGKATPAPPVGPALGQHGVNIMDFCKSFNAKTSAKDQEGLIIPVVITVYHDRTFTFVTKTPPAAVLLKRAAGIAKGSGRAQPQQGGKGHREAGGRNRQAEDAGPECARPGGGRCHHQGHGAQHGIEVTA